MKLMRNPEKKDILNIIIILILAGLFVWIGMEYTKKFGEVKDADIISSAENLKQLILSYGGTGIPVMISFHILQVIVSFIPAAIVQFAGGMIYGIGAGMVIGIVGVSAGTAVSFYLSRHLGRRVITLFISEKNINRLEGLLSKDSSVMVLLILYVIPFPKDFIAYFIGLTNMKASKLFLISAVGRLPGMFVATYLGANILNRNYVLLIITLVVCCVSMVLVYFYGNRYVKTASSSKNLRNSKKYKK